ncbi:hypothetical protein JXA12_05140 [Candidatus Woesearchaeota archaeon]|nr:hypothetical protein [Candidatus Woesearchaeota archaeon]
MGVPRRISRDTPLAELTLRKYEKPSLKGRELVRKLCLSVGLLQPGDSRDVVVDVFLVLLESREELTSVEVEQKVVESREKEGLPLLGIAPSNIRRQLLRLRDLFFVEKVANTYRIAEHETLSALFKEKVESFLLGATVRRVKEYLEAVDKEFPAKRQVL